MGHDLRTKNIFRRPAINPRETEQRLQFLFLVFAACFTFIFVRLFYLQIIQGDKLKQAAESNRTAILLERAPRGLILDRDGTILVDSRPSFVVLFTPLELQKGHLTQITERLAKVLGLDEEEVNKRLRPAIKHKSIIRLMDHVSRQTAFALMEQRPNLPGVSVVIEMQRRYPYGSLASHSLGYLGQISPLEFENLKNDGYQRDWLIGKLGIEKIYDSFLRGEHGGMRIEVDASGHSLKILDRKEPIAGYEVTTTLNLKAQQAAEKGLAAMGKPGAVVALDPRNGEILVMASAPSFDPNAFLALPQGETEVTDTPQDLVTRKDLPLFNRAIQGTYPPGSIFKIVDAAAMLESKKITPDESHYCPGYFWLGSQGSGKKFLCWQKKGHGTVDFQNALINSCNVFFYNCGLKVGPDAIEAMARKFGLGKSSGFEFPGERNGFIPGRSMFKTQQRRWYDGDTINMAIGQGTILFTPMQAAKMISIVASRGKNYRPRIVKEIRTNTGDPCESYPPELISEFKLSDTTWDFIDASLTRVVEEGTGYACRIPGIKVGGKTGTAQNPHGKDHGWFVAYAPVDDPQIAVAAIVESGIHGSSSAAPIIRDILLAVLSPSTTAQAELKAPAPKEGD